MEINKSAENKIGSLFQKEDVEQAISVWCRYSKLLKKYCDSQNETIYHQMISQYETIDYSPITSRVQ